MARAPRSAAMDPAVSGLSAAPVIPVISDALEAVCRVIAPIGGGALIEAFGAEAPATAAATMCALGALALHESAPENGKGPDGHPKEKRA